MLDELIARPGAPVRNAAGGFAYRLDDKLALAQFALTGSMGDTFYGFFDHGDDSIVHATLKFLVRQANDTPFLARLTLYARKHGLMKDTPAALWLLLLQRDPETAHRIFMQVIDNGRMLRTLFRLVRSGELGRNSLSSSLRRAFQHWLNTASVTKILSASIGKDPSLADILRLARPKPIDNSRRALFGWILGRKPESWTPATENDLPREVVQLERFRQAKTETEQIEILETLSVRWDLLASSALGPGVWRCFAEIMGPQALRMNLNTLHRHGVFKRRYDFDGPNVTKMIDLVVRRLTDPEEIRRSGQFPHHYFEAYQSTEYDVPERIRHSLHRAAAIACENVPKLPGPVVICVDISGSMFWPATGLHLHGPSSSPVSRLFRHFGYDLYRCQKPSSSRCVDVAALFAASIFRRNPGSVILPFNEYVRDVIEKPRRREKLLELASRITKIGWGGTDCSEPLKHVRTEMRDRRFAGCIMISDNESWLDREKGGSQTATLFEWELFVKNQQRLGGDECVPKLVCLNLQPHCISLAPERPDILNLGGFSDAVFSTIARFFEGRPASTLVDEIESVVL